jgi:signal transduction histidine kinase/CheY-like chemotaxis protein
MTPERHRRRTQVIVACAVLLIVCSVAVAVFQQQASDVATVGAERTQARILAETSAAALSFGDRATLTRYVHALKADSAIAAVGIYDENGTLSASYGRGLPGRLIQPISDAVAGNESTVTEPIVQDGSRLGAVVLREQLESLPRRISRYLAPAFLLMMAGVMLAFTQIDARSLALANEQLRREIAERERVEAVLRQSQKMEAVGRLTGGIAHDFNNMLAVIMGSLDLLKRRLDGADLRLAALVESALDSTQRAATLTRRLLAFSRLQPLKPQSVDIERTLRGMAELLQRTLGERTKVETVVSGGLWRAHIDRSQLEAAILNMAINARDAMPDGGKLTIEAGNAYLDRAYAEQEPEVAAGQYVMLAITDTGSGIAPENLEKVFEPFFTTKPVGLGTGLGLSQVLGFIKQSGGHVRLYSEPDVGTTVKLYLPRSRAEAEADVAATASRAVAQRREVTVLVVEDEAGVRNFAVQALTELGFDALAAATPKEALAWLQERDDIRILLTDVVMPEMTGRELADAALRRRGGLKVVFMTGYTRNAIVHNGVLDPDTSLLSKPFTVAELERELEAALS